MVSITQWIRSCIPNFPSQPATVHWHRANQSQHWPYNDRRLAGYGVPIFKSLVWLDPGKILAQAGFIPGIFRSQGGRLNHKANEAVPGTEQGYIAHRGAKAATIYLNPLFCFWICLFQFMILTMFKDLSINLSVLYPKSLKRGYV